MKNQNNLHQDELEQLVYWEPQTVGDVVFKLPQFNKIISQMLAYSQDFILLGLHFIHYKEWILDIWLREGIIK